VRLPFSELGRIPGALERAPQAHHRRARGRGRLERRAGDAAAIDLPLAVVVGPYLLLACETPCVDLSAEDFIDKAARATQMPAALEALAESLQLTLERFAIDGEPARAFEQEHTGIFRLDQLSQTQVPALGSSSDQRNADAKTMARGFLIGRYERCDWPSQKALDTKLSRAHALVFAIGGQLYLADVGSTNGIRHSVLGPTRYKHLEVGDVFWLAGEYRLTISKAAR